MSRPVVPADSLRRLLLLPRRPHQQPARRRAAAPPRQASSRPDPTSPSRLMFGPPTPVRARSASAASCRRRSAARAARRRRPSRRCGGRMSTRTIPGLCRSALHAGVISSQGGSITVIARRRQAVVCRNDAKRRVVERLSCKSPTQHRVQGNRAAASGPGSVPEVSRHQPRAAHAVHVPVHRRGHTERRGVGDRRLHGRFRDVPCGVPRRPHPSERRHRHRDARPGACSVRRHHAQRRRSRTTTLRPPSSITFR